MNKRFIIVAVIAGVVALSGLGLASGYVCTAWHWAMCL